MEMTLTRLRRGFTGAGYICDESAALTVYLALQLRKPLLIEGAPGVGKTEMGKALARALGTELIRLQCYEGLDETKALYEWNYQRQLLRIQMNRGPEAAELQEEDLFTMPAGRGWEKCRTAFPPAAGNGGQKPPALLAR